MILKIIFGAPYTITHAMLRGSTDFWKYTYSGTPYCICHKTVTSFDPIPK